MPSLQDFIISQTRVKLLEIFLLDPAKIYYVRELVRLTEEEINAVRRELIQMEEKGMLKKEQRANRLYYGFRRDYPYYNELLQLVAKSTGLGKAIIKEKNRLGKIKFALLSGRFARHKQHQETDVDILIIGDLVMPELSSLVAQFEKELTREINYSVMTEEEFEFRKKRRDPFISQILMGSRVMLIGDDEEMVS
ncbi:nucleotidyltransferase domain-containing protein [Candidatus Beckwithbacteria bacterium]|nr:nucleotidyltransferase domain-containing protein [Candidatus Beckwithbacteria bacterium]